MKVFNFSTLVDLSPRSITRGIIVCFSDNNVILNESDSSAWKFAYICIRGYPHCSLWLFLFIFQLFSRVFIQLPEIVYGTLDACVCVRVYTCTYPVFSFLFVLIPFAYMTIRMKLFGRDEQKKTRFTIYNCSFFSKFILESKLWSQF